MEELGAVRVRRHAAVGAQDASDAASFRIDVIQLVHDRVELGHPGLRRGIEDVLARACEGLIAEPRQTE
jgi:hypothetical protein